MSKDFFFVKKVTHLGETSPCALTLVLRGLVTTTLENFSLSPKNQKESDLSHPGDLSDILRGHFDEKKWMYLLTRG